MIEHLVIRLAAGGGSILAADVVSEEGIWLRAIDVANAEPNRFARIWAVANGVDVALFRQELPSLTDAKIRQIIPSVMADQLGKGAKGQHFAFWAASETEKFVAVASDDYMRRAESTLRGAGMVAAVLVPDYCLLEQSDDLKAVSAADGYCRVKMPDGTGFTVETETTGLMAPGVDVESLSPAEEQALYAGVLHSEANLLQGPYAASAGVSQIMLLFRRAALLFVLLCTLWAAALYGDISNKEAAADQLYSEAEALFREAFPDVSRIVNVDVQARQQIVRLRAGSAPEFLLFSSALFKAVEQSDAALVEAIRFDAARGEMVATLSFPSFAEGEKLKAFLAQENIQVDEGGSRQENSRIYTDITIRSGQ